MTSRSIAVLAAAVLSASANAANIEGRFGAAVPQLPALTAPALPSLTANLPQSLPSAAVPSLAVPEIPAAVVTPAQAHLQALPNIEAQAARPAEPVLGVLQNAANPLPEGASAAERFSAGQRTFDAAGNPGGADPANAYDLPDTQNSWYDRHTGNYETQATKIKKALDLALSNPLASAIKNGLSANTLYRVDNTNGLDRYAVATLGDDPERANEASPVVIFTHEALTQLPAHFLAAKLASMWARHLYRDTIPQSAEKTYIEGSVLVRVFMQLTNSTARWWNGSLDQWKNGNFEIYRHFYHWIQGFRYQNVRQGPYFKDKIMRAEGDPDILANSAGRRTLYQRSQNGEISPDAAAEAQKRFDGFVANERP